MQPGDFAKYADVTYKGTKYRCIYQTATRPKYTYEKNSAYDTQQINWYIYQPIKWLVVDTEQGIVISTTALDAQPFNNSLYSGGTSNNDKEYPILANDYEHSSVRQWLNDDFYNTAFSENEKLQIQISLLDNKAYNNKSEFDSNPTEDKIYLPSYSDLNSMLKSLNGKYNKPVSTYANRDSLLRITYRWDSVDYKNHIPINCRTASNLSSQTNITCDMSSSSIARIWSGEIGNRHGGNVSYISGIMPMMQLNLPHTNDNITGTSGYFTYRDTGNNTCTIIQASPILNGIVTIPSEINGLKVTSISAFAFENCTRITQLTIPSSVVYIGESAFSDLMGLQDIYFKSGSCKILGGAHTIPPKAVIHSCNCAGTDVKEYAEKQGRIYLNSYAKQTILGTKDACYRATCQNRSRNKYSKHRKLRLYVPQIRLFKLLLQTEPYLLENIPNQ